MAGIGDLLSVLMQGGLSPAGNQRAGSAMNDMGQSGGILGQALGGGTAGGSTGSGDLMGSLLGVAKEMMSDTGSPTGRSKTMATGGLGALAGALLGGGSLKGALGGGGMALLASLAMQAFKNADRTPAGVPALTGNQLPLGMRAPASAAEEQELESTAELVLKGMLNAAKADGKIDAAEGDKLTARLKDAGLDNREQQQFMDELRRPLDLDDFVASIPNEAVAAQVYAASLFAINVDTPAERNYLAQLAQRSGLDNHVVKQLHTAVGLA